MPLIKVLQKHGNSQAIVIDKALMDALGIEADTPLQVTISGSSLVITPVDVGVGRDVVTKSLKRLRPTYGQMLKNLAE
jgi:antitoxin component of MazEF toxin-antitoxin module